MRILSWQAHVMLTTILMTVLSTEPVAAQESAPRVTSGYASVNSLQMYYESHGAAHGKHPPPVLLPGGGSAIAISFGRVLPALAKTRQVIAFAQQGHGRTADVERPFTGEPPMSSHTPQDWPRQFAQHLNAGDLEVVVALYEPDARFVARSGETVVGRDRIRTCWPT